MNEALKRYYENEGLEELRISEDNLQYTEFLTITKYLDKLLPDKAKVLDPCAGTGVYSFYLADKGHSVTVGDLFEVNINKLKDKESERLNAVQKKEIFSQPLKDIYVGDVCDLSQFEDESFDSVLCMGALYHMHNEAERKDAVRECLRVLKRGGIFVATYINRLAAILGNCNGGLDSVEELLEFLKSGTEGVFYAHTPVEIDDFMNNFKLESLYHIGADGIGYLLCGEQSILTYEGLIRWRDIHFRTCEIREILGYSYHGAYFGRKT